ncbi:ABC transporter ATP-binding protein [Actinomycetes bacterium]|nr:ABC transporter ATP-binding protein [Actinomycetes bacterium]
MTQMLEAVSIVKSFGAIRVLEDVTLTVLRGEIVGLLGPNGAGKTTLLNIMAGYETQNLGTVSLDGSCIDGLAPEARTKAGLARTFQSGRLFPELSVTENVVLGAIGSGASIKLANRRALDALEMLGLTAVMAQPAAGLSHGLSRLVGLARALTANPKYLIMDEPAAGLNNHETPALLAALEIIQRELGCGMLLIEHNVGLVADACSRVFVLASGELLFEGPPEEALQDEGVLSAYLGDATMGLPGGVS